MALQTNCDMQQNNEDNFWSINYDFYNLQSLFILIIQEIELMKMLRNNDNEDKIISVLIQVEDKYDSTHEMNVQCV